MKNKNCRFFGLAVWMSCSILSAQESAFELPYLSNIHVDGMEEDWHGMGFLVGLIGDAQGRFLRAGDFDVRFRLAWDERGLLGFVRVLDDVAVESEDPNELWEKDCVELFLSPGSESSGRIILILSPGRDPRFKTVRIQEFDQRKNGADHKLHYEAAASAVQDGYRIEFLLPWDNLGINSGMGTEFGFQLRANDDDGTDEPFRVYWFDDRGSGGDVDRLMRIRLANTGSEPVLARVRRGIGLDGCSIEVTGAAELLNQKVEILGPKHLARGRMGEEGGRSTFRAQIPMNRSGEWPEMLVRIGGKTKARFEGLPSLQSILSRYLDALGGREALEKLESRACRGNYVHEFPRSDPQVVSVPMENHALFPDRWCTILRAEQGNYIEGYSGKTGWRKNYDRVEKVAGLGTSRLGWVLNTKGPLMMDTYFPNLRLVEKTAVRGRDVYALISNFANGTSRVLYMDRETGLPVQLGPDWEFQDYRRVDGVLFPFRVVLHREGGTSTFAFDEVTHNGPVSESVFEVPELEDAFPEAFKGIDDPDVLRLLTLKDPAFSHEEMNVPCRDGRFLYDLILKNGYKEGLEIGTFTGYSALWMGLGFRKTGGKLITIEIDSAAAKIARAQIKTAGLGDAVDSRINDAFKEIDTIPGQFDFVFIDAWKPDYILFLRQIRDRMKPGGAIVAHNVTNGVHEMRDYLQAIQNDPGLKTTFHPISEEGIAVSVVVK